MLKYTARILLLILLTSLNLQAQQVHKHADYFVGGISTKIGFGHAVVKDEFISQEKYSGNFTSFSIDWSRFHTSNGFHLSFEAVNAALIENYNISAELTQFTLNLVYLYPIGTKKLFGKPAYFFLGPAPEISMYFRSQNIAGRIKSGALFISLGIHLELIFPFHKYFQLEGYFQSSLISLGTKSFDTRDENNSPVKVLPFWKGMNYKFDLSARYKLSKLFSIKGGYRFNLLRVSAWDYLMAASDNVYLTLSVSL